MRGILSWNVGNHHGFGVLMWPASDRSKLDRASLQQVLMTFLGLQAVDRRAIKHGTPFVPSCRTPPAPCSRKQHEYAWISVPGLQVSRCLCVGDAFLDLVSRPRAIQAPLCGCCGTVQSGRGLLVCEQLLQRLLMPRKTDRCLASTSSMSKIPGIKHE